MASFEHFSEALAQSESPLPPAEVHGLMSALVCVPGVGRMSVLQGEVLLEDVPAVRCNDSEYCFRMYVETKNRMRASMKI